jgi:hypothetical protein
MSLRGSKSVIVRVALAAAASVVAMFGVNTASVGATPSAGYRLLGGDGGVFAFGAPFFGSAASDPAKCPANVTDRFMPNGTCWSMASTPDGGGYWVLNASTGAVYAFGDAKYFGSPADVTPPVPREFVPNYIAIAPTPDGQGYWLLAHGLSGLGSVAAFGDAKSYGDETTPPAVGHAGIPVALVPTLTGNGYWIVDSDGGVFSFGNAVFYGSVAGSRLAGPVVGATRTPDGRGYWLAGSDGGVFSFGDAAFAGSMSGHQLAGPIVGVAANPGGAGYWLAARDGGVFAFGGAPFLGSVAGTKLNQPIFAITARIPTAV